MSNKGQPSKFHPDKDFIVRDSKWMNYVVSLILLALFIVTVVSGDPEWTNYLFATVLLAASIFFIVKARKSQVSMIINRTGFRYQNKLLFGWNQFIDAKLTQEAKVARFNDNFIILIRYHSPDKKMIYTSKIPMSNVQDKEDEEIIAAINFYFKNRNS